MLCCMYRLLNDYCRFGMMCVFSVNDVELCLIWLLLMKVLFFLCIIFRCVFRVLVGLKCLFILIDFLSVLLLVKLNVVLLLKVLVGCLVMKLVMLLGVLKLYMKFDRFLSSFMCLKCLSGILLF